MDIRSRIAARVHEIAPFHVMEVQTAARALEAAGRTVVHMEIGEPDFPTPEPVLAAARQALVGGAIYGTSLLLAHAIAGTHAKVSLGSFPPLLAVVTAIAGMLLGAAGGRIARALRRPAAAPEDTLA